MKIYHIHRLLPDFQFFPEGDCGLNHTFFRKVPSLDLNILNNREYAMSADEQIPYCHQNTGCNFKFEFLLVLALENYYTCVQKIKIPISSQSIAVQFFHISPAMHSAQITWNIFCPKYKLIILAFHLHKPFLFLLILTHFISSNHKKFCSLSTNAK